MNAFDRRIGGFFRDAVRTNWRDPAAVARFTRMAVRQRQAADRRRRWEQSGVHVPPLLIVSVTRRCDLSCTGCYVQAQDRPAEAELSVAELTTILEDARDLGVSMVALTGGEPLMRPEVIDVAASLPEIAFPIVTNGRLLDEAVLDRLERARNVVPVIRMEGLSEETDGRRGRGVYDTVTEAMERMHRRGLFFGASIMVTRPNFAFTTSRSFVRGLVERGCRLFFYVDYVPIEPGTDHLAPSESQRSSEPLTMALLRSEFRRLFVASSVSEAALGGCLAAGKGFVHVSAEGDLEPCPFSPFSDTNLREVPLRSALQSRLLRHIRESEEHLDEGDGGRALWTKREWLETLQTGRATTGVTRCGPAGGPPERRAA